MALHYAVIVAGLAALYLGIGGWWAAPLYALAIGHSFAGAAFVGHETLHGAVIRHRGARNVIGWLCFLPFTLSPRLWVAWHNKTHHAHTMDEPARSRRLPDAGDLSHAAKSRASPTSLAFGHRRWAAG